MKKSILLLAALFVLMAKSSLAQYNQQDTTFKRCFVGSTLFVLYNFVPDDNSPDFVQLNLGYRLSHRDVLSIELKTWKYAWSLGIPYGSDFEAPEEKFPGYIREVGFAIVYQRFVWKGLYAGVHTMNSWQDFVNDEGIKIKDGFQLFNTYRVGYHVKLFKNRFFIEPSVAITHRAYHTEMPASFKKLDQKRSKFFFGEPGFHIGYNF